MSKHYTVLSLTATLSTLNLLADLLFTAHYDVETLIIPSLHTQTLR